MTFLLPNQQRQRTEGKEIAVAVVLIFLLTISGFCILLGMKRVYAHIA